MWILQILKETFNSSFDYFLKKVKGRYLAFLVQLVISYLAVAVFTLVISMIIVSMLNQGSFSIDVFSMNGLFEWMRMIDPVWGVTAVIAVNFLFKADLSAKTMSFPDFYKEKSPQFWLDLVIAVVTLAVVLTIYYKNELMLQFGVDPIEQLINVGFDGMQSPMVELLSNWIYYSVISLPTAAVILIEVRDRKRNGFRLKRSFWKILITSLLLSFVITWAFDDVLFIFGNLVMNLIYAPFELIEIPAFLGVVVTILFKTLNFMFLASVFHFAIKHSMEKDSTVKVDSQDKSELLDL